jgi:uncharacterized protein
MKVRHWLLPETPDVIGMLHSQIRVTGEGIAAFRDWAEGDAAAAERVHGAEQRGDVAKRELLAVLRTAFVTAIEPEDVFALSRCVEWILDYTNDLVNESIAMATPPDRRIAEMAALLGEAVGHLDEAVRQLGVDADRATAEADAAVAAERRLEHAYYVGMAALLDVDDRTERIARRELYRRCSRIGDSVVEAAERVVYTVVKQA